MWARLAPIPKRFPKEPKLLWAELCRCGQKKRDQYKHIHLNWFLQGLQNLATNDKKHWMGSARIKTIMCSIVVPPNPREVQK